MGSHQNGILKSISNEQKNPLIFDHPTIRLLCPCRNRAAKIARLQFGGRFYELVEISEAIVPYFQIDTFFNPPRGHYLLLRQTPTGPNRSHYD